MTMRPTYADLTMWIDERTRPDRAPQMPLLGLASGLIFALSLWSGIGWLAWAVVG